MDPADISGDIVLGTTVILLGFIAAAALFYQIVSDGVVIGDVRTQYNLHMYELDLHRMAIVVLPQMLKHSAYLAAYELGRKGGVGTDNFYWYDDARTIKKLIPLYKNYLHSSADNTVTFDVSSYNQHSSLVVLIEAHRNTSGIATVTINGISRTIEAGRTFVSVPYPSSDQLTISIVNPGSFLIEGIFVSYEQSVLESMYDVFQAKFTEEFDELKSRRNDRYSLDGTPIAFFSADGETGNVGLLFIPGLSAISPTRTEEEKPTLVVMHKKMYLESTYVPYWKMYDVAVEDSEENTESRRESFSGTNELFDDNIEYTDYYCEENSGKDTSCTELTCEQIFLQKTGKESYNKYIEDGFGTLLGNWAATVNGFAKSFAIRSLETVSSPTSIIPEQTEAYTTETVGEDVTACGCKLYNECCVETVTSCGNSGDYSSYACNTNTDGSAVTQTQCNTGTRNTYCDWDGADCVPKACSTWNSDSSTCSAAGCSPITTCAPGQFKRDPVCGCETAYSKSKCSSTCTYKYNYRLTLEGRVTSSEQVYVDGEWKALIFSFFERFTVHDEDIDHSSPQAYVSDTDS